MPRGSHTSVMRQGRQCSALRRAAEPTRRTALPACGSDRVRVLHLVAPLSSSLLSSPVSLFLPSSLPPSLCVHVGSRTARGWLSGCAWFRRPARRPARPDCADAQSHTQRHQHQPHTHQEHSCASRAQQVAPREPRIVTMLPLFSATFVFVFLGSPLAFAADPPSASASHRSAICLPHTKHRHYSNGRK